MTRHTLKITALCLPLLLLLMFALPACATTYYIDYATGSNSNAGTSKAAPWKTHPYMQTGSGCTGGVTGWGGWTHAAGDRYIFKGGVTWPAACFQMSIPKGGTSSATDYYGVDVTWFAGSSFARPLFDMAQNVPTGTHVITVTSAFPGYATFDNLEIANQRLTLTTCTSCDDAYNFAAVSGSLPGVLIENGYIHDWVSNTNVAAISGSGVWPYSGGAIYDGHDRITVDHMTVEDSAGFVFAGTTKITGGYSGACENCGTVSNSTFHDVAAACFTVASCHDNEFYNVNQKIYDYCGDVTGHAGGQCRPHSQVIEDDQPCGTATSSWMKVYNNAIHDVDAGVNIFVKYDIGALYNNVLWNIANNYPIRLCIPGGNNVSTAVGSIYQNSALCPSNCVGPQSSTDNFAGTVKMTNNVWITNSAPLCFNGSGTCAAHITTLTQTTNYTMPTSEASTYGFTASNKLKPSSSDSHVAGAGTNLTSSCNGNFSALCQDASGTPWFGGSFITRPTGSTAWDLGAYMGQGSGGSGPPSISISSPSPGTVSGSVNLTATCTPQGSATVSSIQFTIDGFPFGAAGTSSPYMLSWNTATAANANHVIGATCTDSNAQVGTAATVSVAVSNSIPGCFISTDNDSGALSWTANQSFTAQSANFTATFTATPNTNNQDTVVALSENAMSAYTEGAALLRFSSSGFIDVYKGTISNYTSDNSAPYTAGTTYSFTYTINFTGPNAGTYSVSETSPSSIAIATNYAFRSTALIASLGFINAISVNTTPDTAKVCNLQVSGSTSLTFSPSTLGFGNITVGSNATQTFTATTSGGSVNFSSVGIGGNADFTINSNTCSGSVPSSCTTQIQFAPTSAALETATVTYTDDATGSPQSLAVSGTGVPATPTLSVSPTSVNFGGVLVHTTSSSGPIILTISSGPVTFTGTPSFSGANAADFSLASNSCTGTVSAASCQTVVSFTPSLVAAESATLTYTDNATGSPQSVALSGTGYLAPHPPTAVHATVN